MMKILKVGYQKNFQNYMDIKCKRHLIYRASYEGVSADARMGYDPRVNEIQGGPG